MKNFFVILASCSALLLTHINALAQDSLNIRRICSFTAAGDIRDVAIRGQYAYLAAGTGGLRIIDISDTLAIHEVGTYDSPGYVWVLAVTDSFAFLADYTQGFRVVDITNPAAPVSAGACATADLMEGITIQDSIAYAAIGMSGVQVISIRNPRSPSIRGTYNTPGYARIIDAMGTYAYVADFNGGLQIINAANPSAPVQTGFFLTLGGAMGVAVRGDYAYVADRAQGLRIVDIRTPSAPIEIGFCDTPGNAWDIAVAGDYAYVVDSNQGLRVINISDPSAPVVAGFYDTPGTAEGVAVSGNYVYVADVTSLQVLEFVVDSGIVEYPSISILIPEDSSTTETLPFYMMVLVEHFNVAAAPDGDGEIEVRVNGTVESWLTDPITAQANVLSEGMNTVELELVTHDHQPLTNHVMDSIHVTYESDAAERLPDGVAHEFALFAPYPNPFNSTTQIKYTLPSTERVSLLLYDVLGREVTVLMNKIKPAGEHQITFDATGLASGVYLCRMEAGSFAQTRKLVLLR
jgi:hypothetical protein